VTFTSGTNTINGTVGAGATLNAGDQLTGGSGTDTLASTGAGTADLFALAAFSGIENVTLAASETLVLRNSIGLNVVATAGGGDSRSVARYRRRSPLPWGASAEAGLARRLIRGSTALQALAALA